MCVYTDIKECDIGRHNCSQQCIEEPGAFRCDCYSGFQLQEDKITCEGSYGSYIVYDTTIIKCKLKYSNKTYRCCRLFCI